MNSSISAALLQRMRLLTDVCMEQTHLLFSSDISLSINNEFIDVCMCVLVCVCVSDISNSLLWGSVLKLQSTVHESQG